MFDDTVQITEELTNPTFASNAGAGMQQSPMIADHNRNTCLLSAASGVTDLMSQEGAGRVKARSIHSSDTAVTSPDTQKVFAHFDSQFSNGNTAFFICSDSLRAVSLWGQCASGSRCSQARFAH